MNNKEQNTLPVVQPSVSNQFKEQANKEFYTAHQGQATSIIIKGINSPVKLDLFSGNGTVTDQDKKLIFENYVDIMKGIKLTAKQLFTALIIEATEGKTTNSTVKLPIEKYMKMRGLKNIKETRKQVKADLKVLKTVRIEWREKRKKQSGSYLNIYLFGGTEGIKNGVIEFKFNTDFFNCLKGYNIAPLSKEILKINDKYNPNSFYFSERIGTHKNMNYYKSNADIIGVKTLLESTSELPKYEDIKETGEITRRIIDPFERDMDAMINPKWNYCGTNGVQIDAPEGYKEFEKALIKLTWINYPIREKKAIKNSNKKTTKTEKKGG